MIFAQPLAWFLFLLAIPIVLLYILKVRLRQEPVSTALFWQQVFDERRTRSFWRRLRHLMSLLLSLLFLTLLTGAVLNPVSTRQKPVRCVIVVDNSASMNARLHGSTRLEQAKTDIRPMLDKLGSVPQTAILTAGGPPRIVVGFTDHLGTLRRAVDSIEATDSPTSLSEAIQLAQQLVAAGSPAANSEEPSQILVYTDGCTENLAELRALPNVLFFPVGQPTDNWAITKFQPRRSLGDAVGYEILAEVVHFGSEPVEARLEIELEERVVDVIPLTLEPNVPQTKIIRDTSSQGGVLRATLKTVDREDDSFPTDDRAVAILPERPTQHVYLYGDEDFFLLRVLQSQPNLEIHFLTELPDRVPEDGVLVIHRRVPETLPAGNIFVVDPRSSGSLFDVGEPLDESLGGPLIADTDDESPLMKFVHLKNLAIRGARHVTWKTTPAEWKVLASTPEAAPIYAFLKQDDSQIMVLSADLSQSDLALRTAFPIMISQALTVFRGSGGELERAWSTGQTVPIPAQSRLIQANHVSLGLLQETGIWTLYAEDGKELGKMACNLSNATESNLRLAPPLFYADFYADHQNAALRSGSRPLWFLLALLALLFTCVEWFLYQRRWID